MNIYYVYFYLRSKDSETARAGTPYYIGKGCKNRAWNKHCNVPVPKDKSKIILVKEELTELQAFILERYYIKWFGRKGIDENGVLRNITEGGEGIDSNTASILNFKKVKNGNNPWQRRPDGSSYSKDRVINGTHPLLGKNLSGTHNPKYNNQKHQFKHKDGKIFIGTQFEFRNKYKLDQGNVTKLIQERSKSVKGWYLSISP